MNYWDKFVRKKVKDKYKNQFDEEELDRKLGFNKVSNQATGFLSRYNHSSFFHLFVHFVAVCYILLCTVIYYVICYYVLYIFHYLTLLGVTLSGYVTCCVMLLCYIICYIVYYVTLIVTRGYLLHYFICCLRYLLRYFIFYCKYAAYFTLFITAHHLLHYVPCYATVSLLMLCYLLS